MLMVEEDDMVYDPPAPRAGLVGLVDRIVVAAVERPVLAVALILGCAVAGGVWTWCAEWRAELDRRGWL